MNNSQVKKRGRPSKAAIAAKTQPNSSDSNSTSSVQTPTPPTTVTTQQQQQGETFSNLMRSTPVVKPISNPSTTPANTSSMSLPGRTPAPAMAPSMMKPSTMQPSLSLQQQQLMTQQQQLMKRKLGFGGASAMPPPTNAGGAALPNQSASSNSANTLHQTITNSLLSNSLMNALPNTQTFSVLLQQQLQQHASIGAIPPINFLDEVAKIMQSFGETKFCVFETVKLVEQFTKKKCTQLVDKMIANRYDLFHFQKKRSWDSVKEDTTDSISEQTAAPLLKKQKTDENFEGTPTTAARPSVLSNPLDVEEEEEEDQEVNVSVQAPPPPEQLLFKEEEKTPTESGPSITSAFLVNPASTIVVTDEKKKQKKILEDNYTNKSLDVSDVLYLFNKNPWKWKRLERISRLVPFQLEYIAEDATQNFSEGILKSIQLANVPSKDFHFLPTVYESEQEELNSEDEQEFIKFEKERLQLLAQHVSSMSEEQYKEYQSLKMENFQSRKFREWLGIKDVTFTDAGLALLQHLAWEYVGLVTLTSLIVKREMNANQYKNIMISKNIKHIVSKILVDNEMFEEKMGIITGVMSKNMRNRLKQNTLNYLIPLPSDFKLTKAEEEEFQEQPIQISHVYEAIRRMNKLQKQDFQLIFV